MLSVSEKAETLVLNYIKEKWDKKRKVLKRLHEENETIRNNLEKAIEGFKQFELTHIKELQNIYCLKDGYFSGPINDIHNYLHHLDYKLRESRCLAMELPPDEADLFFCSMDSVIISHQELDVALGLSQKTCKKYLDVLKEKNLIQGKRGLFGIEYKLNLQYNAAESH